jgi:carbonic anhydrase/acetyltransferase-like protein (isoleucine patch superfamily)
VTEGKVFEDGMLIVGAPARAIRPLNEGDLARMHMGTALYVAKSSEYKNDLVRIDAPKP